MTSPSSSPDSPGLRASDAERERVAEALRGHHVDGRLDTEELQERLERAYAARTTAELRPLLADLPRDEAPRPRGRSFGPWPPALVALIAVVLVLTTIAAVAHGHPGPLPFLAVFLLLRFAWWGPRRRTAWGPRV
jgi:hypothetical protein